MRKLLMILPMIMMLHPVNIIAEDDAQTRAPACQYQVIYTQNSYSNNQYGIVTDQAKNDTGTSQVMQVTRTRKQIFTGTVGVKAERDAILAKIGVNAEVSYGVEKSISYTAITTVPPYKTYKVDIGSNLVRTSGTLKTRNTDCSTSTKSGSIRVTSGVYVRWYE